MIKKIFVFALLLMLVLSSGSWARKVMRRGLPSSLVPSVTKAPFRRMMIDSQDGTAVAAGDFSYLRAGKVVLASRGAAGKAGVVCTGDTYTTSGRTRLLATVKFFNTEWTNFSPTNAACRVVVSILNAAGDPVAISGVDEDEVVRDHERGGPVLAVDKARYVTYHARTASLVPAGTYTPKVEIVLYTLAGNGKGVVIGSLKEISLGATR